MGLQPHANFQHNLSSRFRRTKKGAHGRNAAPLTFVKSPDNWSLTTYQISAKSVQPFPRYRKWDTSARARVQTCPTHDMMHRCLVSKHNNFGRHRPSHSWVIASRGQFWHPLHGTRFLPGWPLPYELNPTVIKVAWMDPSLCEDRMETECTATEI